MNFWIREKGLPPKHQGEGSGNGRDLGKVILK